jgi:hypothetical protein
MPSPEFFLLLYLSTLSEQVSLFMSLQLFIEKQTRVVLLQVRVFLKVFTYRF